MNINYKYNKLLAILIFVCSYSIVCCKAKDKKQVFISNNNPQIEYMGRVAINDSASIIYWSGTSVAINFEGSEVSALMKDEKGNNYFNIVIDGYKVIKFNPDTNKKLYTLVSGLEPGKHNIQIFKLTEEGHGKTYFYGFELNADGKILEKPAPRLRKMEFYGNSITSGYSVEDTNADSRNPQFFNNYLSYASITARHYDATYYCISKSGIGITVSWFPIIMPEMYDRLDSKDPASKWKFDNYTPDVVVVNLLSNDIDLINMPNDENFIARFGKTKPKPNYIITAYKNFIASIRNKYPYASIVCTLDSWKDPESDGHLYPQFITKAIASMNDAKIYSYFFDYKKLKKKGHPKAKDHEAMAKGLISFIDANIKW